MPSSATSTILFLNSAPEKSVDVIITDPPYTEHVHANLCSGSLVGTKAVPKYELKFEPLEGTRWLKYAMRVARRWVVVFAPLEQFGRYEDALGHKKGADSAGYVRGCVWYKSNAMGQLTADRPATAFEGIALLHPEGTPRWNGRGSYGIWRCNGTRGKKGRHPNEKPIDLCRKLVALFSDRGETVLDPFCGSGAIGQACVELGRRYIGLDNDAEWAGKAGNRMPAGAPWGHLADEAALALCSMRGEDPPMEEAA